MTTEKTRGLPMLQSDETLATAAQAHARRMRDGGFFDHVDPVTGSGPMERVGSVESASWAVIAENLAAGPWLPEQVLDGWIASPGHHANLVLADVRPIGTAVMESPRTRSLVVQVYGSLRTGPWGERILVSSREATPQPGRIRAPSFRREIDGGRLKP
jgi:uncharacterized protein YkwD